jgi:type VI secretion system secreted protein Hcp
MAVDMFLKITSAEGDVAGESTDKNHTGEIDILAWNWGLSQSGSTHLGKGGGSGKVNVQDLSFTKYVDKSSPTLLKLCCKGTHIPEALLTVRKAGGDDPVEYVKLKLKECIVSSITSGGSGGADRVTENVALNFAEFHFEYTPQEADNSAGSSIPMGWSVAKNAEAS